MNSINQLTFKILNDSGKSVFFKESLASTNDQAKTEFPHLNKNFATYLTDHQTHGRGRNKNEWSDLGDGKTLLSTWCFKLNKSPQPIITPLLGLALYNCLLQLKPKSSLRIKPPNDIYLNEGKVSGILVEMSQLGNEYSLYIGLGINVFAAPKIDTKTSSLNEATQINDALWSTFCSNLISHFESAIEKSYSAELTNSDRLELLNALNINLPKDEEYIDISSKCDLYTRSGKTSWMDL